MNDPGNGKGTPQQQLLDAHSKLIGGLWEIWKDHRSINAENIDPVKYSRLSIVSLTQVASVIAVDVGMDQEQFLKICEANFRDALAKAPKWG